MPFDAFLKFATIPGESTDDKHKEWIEVLSFSWGVVQQKGGAVSATSAHAGQRADFGDLNVTKSLDKASPKIALACAGGEPIADVTLELCKAGGDKQKYMSVKMKDVIVSSYQSGGSAGGSTDVRPLEQVSLVYSQIEWEYTQIDEKGQPKGTVPAGWDLKTNKKI